MKVKSVWVSLASAGGCSSIIGQLRWLCWCWFGINRDASSRHASTANPNHAAHVPAISAAGMVDPAEKVMTPASVSREATVHPIASNAKAVIVAARRRSVCQKASVESRMDGE